MFFGASRGFRLLVFFLFVLIIASFSSLFTIGDSGAIYGNPNDVILHNLVIKKISPINIPYIPKKVDIINSNRILFHNVLLSICYINIITYRSIF